MLEIEDNVRQAVIRLVPSSVVNEITCFTFYDEHPKDDFNLEIIVCTKNCEILEYYMRELVLSSLLKLSSKPKEIQIVRNKKSELFYLVASQCEILILLRRSNIQIHKIITNVNRYNIEDYNCTGHPHLRVFSNDDAVPMIYDENFDPTDSSMSTNISKNGNEPIVIQLQRKLIEIRYSIQCNEKAYEDITKLRQLATEALAQKTCLTSEDILSHNSKVSGGLVVTKPWVVMCNKQIVIVFHITNKYSQCVENIQILLDTAQSLLTYSTKIYENVEKAPYWQEKKRNCVDTQCSVYIAVVISMKELCDSVLSKFDVEGIICYQTDGNELALPVPKVEISASDIMGDNFDVLCNENSTTVQKQPILTLALLATSVKTELCLRHIKNDDEVTILDMSSVFVKYLQMEQYEDMKTVVIHRKSPHHLLYGVLLICNNDFPRNHIYNATVYSRHQSQVLALIHFIYDSIPLRIISTTPQYTLQAKTPELKQYNETTNSSQQSLNFREYAQSLIKQTAMILQYFDACMIKMNENKSPAVQSKIGREIDLFAVGPEMYAEFRRKLLDESARSVEVLTSENNDVEEDCMIVDD